MALMNEDIVSILNNLIETAKDGQNGFKEAAESLKNPLIKSMFQEFSRQRAAIVMELQQEVRRLGGNAETTGSAAAVVHRGWIDLKSAITGKDDGAVVAEAERGEDIAKAAFQKAAGADLPEPTRSIVQEHCAKVLAAHDRVRNLERATTR